MMIEPNNEDRDRVIFPQPQRPLEAKWKTSNSDFPPKLKPASMSGSCHLYLIYSVTVLCVLLSTYSFSHTFKLQHEVPGISDFMVSSKGSFL